MDNQKTDKSQPPQKQPISIEDALGSRMENEEDIIPEDEMIRQALQDANAEIQVNPDVPQQMTPVPTGPIEEDARRKIETEIAETEIHASNGNPPLVIQTSTPAFQEQSKQKTSDSDSALDAVREFIAGDCYGPKWVELHLINLSRFPNFVPCPTLWDIPGGLDISRLVYDIMLTPGYIEGIWPCLTILMGTSIDNITWTAGVATTLAVFDAIRILPVAKQAGGPCQ